MENGVTFDIVKNAKCVTTDVNTCKKSYELFNEPIDSNPHIFFLFETPYHMAFGHWVVECGIFLPFFKHFTDASILVNKNPHRDYKNLFFKLFNITNITYLDNNEDTMTEYTNIPKNNICIVCRNHTQNNRTPTSENLSQYLKLLVDFREILTKDLFDYKKDIDHLFLPRNTTQNYKHNDRKIDYTQINQMLAGKEFTEYKTSDTVDFNDQIRLVSRSKNIYLDYGANFVVNGLFSKNSHIFCTNPMLIFQHQYPYGRVTCELIAKENVVTYL